MNRDIEIYGYVCGTLKRSDKEITITVAYVKGNKLEYVTIVPTNKINTQKIKKGAQIHATGHMQEHTYLAKDFSRIIIHEMVADVNIKN